MTAYQTPHGGPAYATSRASLADEERVEELRTARLYLVDDARWADEELSRAENRADRIAAEMQRIDDQIELLCGVRPLEGLR